jgi:arabinofuranan 3-O-arabinosyltransferase
VNASARGDGGFDVSVQNAQRPFYLVIGQNIAPGWRASIDGADLGAPAVLDGYSAGWFVNKKGSYHVVVSYGPQRRFRAATLVSAVAVAASVVLVGAEVRRRRRLRR